MLYEVAILALFWLGFKLYGLYVATAILMGALLLQCLFSWVRHRKVPTMQWVACLSAWLLGGSTLLFHDPVFIQWKPTVLYLIMAFGVLGFNAIKGSYAIKKILLASPGLKIEAPHRFWLLLDRLLVVFLLLMAGLNRYVAEHYSTEAWVQFKLFGTLGATLLLALLFGYLISKKAHVIQE